MRPTKLTEKLSVAAQPDVTDFSELKRLGFTTVINHRPDGEDAAQPGSAAEEAAAHAAGLAYVHMPVAGSLTGADARKFDAAIAASPGPVIAHCRSGTRSFRLWLLAGALNDHTDSEVLALADQIGLDAEATKVWLAEQRDAVARAGS